MRILLLVACTVIFIGCESLERFAKEHGNSESSVEETLAPARPTYLIASDNLELQPAPVPTRGTRYGTFILSSNNSRLSFRPGETIALSFQDINWNTHSIKTEFDSVSNLITMSLVSNEENIIYLRKKCDIVNISGIAEIPRIQVAPDLRSEQVVVTPLFDTNCNKVGYQVRYGSSERGCRAEAQSVLERLRRCSGDQQPSAPKRTCPEWIMFRVPCP